MSQGELPLFSDDEVGLSVEKDLQAAEGLYGLLGVNGLGNTRALRLAERVGSSRRLAELSEGELAAIVGPAAAANLRAAPWEVVLPVPEGSSAIGYFDAEYPASLRSIPDPPALLWVRGRLPSQAAVAVVGTRRPTAWSIRTATLVTESAVESGYAVVSGLALGTDTVAHEACLAAGGVTVAVLGSAVDQPSPAVNRRLADQIVESGGCVLAEVPPGTPPTAATLIARDRLQAGLSAATVVIQSGVPGGTLHTARFAVEQDRVLVVALPRPLGDQPLDAVAYAGNLALTSDEGCDPTILRATGPLARKIGARRPVADLVISSAEDLEALWARLNGLDFGGPDGLKAGGGSGG